MNLRGRFTLWFSLAALVPIAAATLVTREVLTRSYLSDFEDDRKGAEKRATSLVAELQNDVEKRISGLASAEHSLVGGLLIELEKNSGTLPAIERRRLVKQPLLSFASLDILFIVDSGDTVLAAPHNRGLRDSLRPALRERAAASAGMAFFAIEPVIRGDTMDSALVVESGQVVRGDGQVVTVVGGREVGKAFVDKLRDERRVDARIVDGGGTELVSPARTWESSPRSPPIRVPLPGPEDRPVAWLEVAVSDADLADLLEEVTVSSFVLGGGALLVTIIIGFVVSRRMSRDLDELVRGAEAVSADDYDYRIAVRARDEIAAVADAFNSMLEDLQESKQRLVTAERIAAWQEIARSLAHEIKNPLTPIQMSVETMRRSHAKKHPSFEEIFEESTATILEETGRLKRIVSEFSEFARMPKPNMVPADIGEIVRSAVALYKGSVTVDCDLEPGIPRAMVDRDQLTQVLLNLLENARDAIGSSGAPGGTIHVETRLAAGGHAIELVVGDSGPGIPDEARDKIFTPYFTTKGQRGTGLGLATVHRIVSDHGGRIRVDRSALGGAELVIALPTGPTPLALTYRSVPRS